MGSVRHVVLGTGNLGLDLERELSVNSKSALLIPNRGRRFQTRESVRSYADAVAELKGDVFWYCLGGYTAGDQGEEMANAITRVPVMLRELLLPQQRLVLFSTDYAADEEFPNQPKLRARPARSSYASEKAELERQILSADFPNTLIVRVTSLYGEHHPERTLPGKIIRNYWSLTDDRIALPWNRVTPTPSRWVAQMMAKHAMALFSKEGAEIHHCAPNLNAPIQTVGKYVLPERELGWSIQEFFDDRRPRVSALGCSFVDSVDDWLTIWKEYFRRDRYVPFDFPKTPATRCEARALPHREPPRGRTSGP